MCGKSEAGLRPIAGHRYYKRVRHLAGIVSLVILSAGAADFHAATPRVAPAALPFAPSWSREFAGAPPVAAAVSDAGWIVAGFADHVEFVAADSGERAATLPIPAARLSCQAALCLAADESTIRAVDVTRRTVSWQRPLPAPLVADPVLRSGWVFLTTGDGQIAALRESDGTTVWTYAAHAPLTGAPSVDGDRLALATTRDEVTLLDVRTGKAVWTTPIYTGHPGAPKLGGGTVLVGTDARELLFIDAENGRLLATQRPASAIVGAPALDEHSVYTVGFDGVLRAFDRGTRALSWYADLPTRPAASGLAAGGDLVVVALRTGAFYGYLWDTTGKKPAVAIAAPGAADTSQRLLVPPIIAGTGVGMRLVTISGGVGDASKWSATLFSGGARLAVSETPAMVSGLGLTLTKPQ